ncbi:MAG: hypothetical protein R8K54_06820 [Mariprofundaceae bacterium]
MNDPHQGKKANDLHDESLANLYQQTRIEEPPMALDSVILSEARKSVEKAKEKPIWNRIGWIPSLATAAVALLTVSLVIQTGQEHPESMAPAMIDAAPMQEQGMAIEEDEQPVPAKQTVEEKDQQAPTAKAKRMLKIERRAADVQQFKAAPAPTQSEGMASDMMVTEPEVLGAARARSSAKAELSIDEWLKQIRDLIQAGKLDEARKSLEAFKKAHPDYSLPEDIHSVLE